MSEEEKRIEEKIKKLATEATRDAIKDLLPNVVSHANSILDSHVTKREQIIIGAVIASLLKQIMFIAISMDNNALEKIAEEVFNEMGDE